MRVPRTKRAVRSGIELVDSQGKPVVREVVTSNLSADAVELGEFRHYMQKEIFEQPQALGNTLAMLGGAGRWSRRLKPGQNSLPKSSTHCSLAVAAIIPLLWKAR